jgi:hypothetical protein
MEDIWMPREEKDNAIKLPLLAISPDMASFGGVVFRRVAQDQLVVDLTIRTQDGAKTEVLKLRRRPL